MHSKMLLIDDIKKCTYVFSHILYARMNPNSEDNVKYTKTKTFAFRWSTTR